MGTSIQKIFETSGYQKIIFPVLIAAEMRLQSNTNFHVHLI